MPLWVIKGTVSRDFYSPFFETSERPSHYEYVASLGLNMKDLFVWIRVWDGLIKEWKIKSQKPIHSVNSSRPYTTYTRMVTRETEHRQIVNCAVSKFWIPVGIHSRRLKVATVCNIVLNLSPARMWPLLEYKIPTDCELPSVKCCIHTVLQKMNF